jgi:hypothetical protein
MTARGSKRLHKFVEEHFSYRDLAAIGLRLTMKLPTERNNNDLVAASGG